MFRDGSTCSSELTEDGEEFSWLQVLLSDQKACLSITHATADAQQGQLCDQPQVSTAKISYLLSSFL